jgi:predicted alpha/beta hydrolase
LLQVSDDYVHGVIRAFNERAFDALAQNRAGDARRRSVSNSAPGSARSPGRPRADWGITEFPAFIKVLRARRPDQKLYVVCDNFGPHRHAFAPHRHARVRGWCERNGVKLGTCRPTGPG